MHARDIYGKDAGARIKIQQQLDFYAWFPPPLQMDSLVVSAEKKCIIASVGWRIYGKVIILLLLCCIDVTSHKIVPSTWCMNIKKKALLVDLHPIKWNKAMGGVQAFWNLLGQKKLMTLICMPRLWPTWNEAVCVSFSVTTSRICGLEMQPWSGKNLCEQVKPWKWQLSDGGTEFY